MKISRELVELLERPVDVKKLVDRLFFSADDLEDAAIRQPKLYFAAGRFKAQAAMRVSMLKRRLGKIAGEESVKLRHKQEYKTEGAIKSRLALNKDVQHEQKKFDEAEVYYEFASQLTEAYKERLMVIAILSRIQVSEMNSSLRSVKNEETVSAMRKRAHGARKAFEELEGDDI